MDVDRKLDHLVGRDTLVLIFWMRNARIGQVVGGIELLSGHGWKGWIDNGKTLAHLLYEAMGMHHVRLFLDVAEILSLRTLVAQTLLVTMKHDVGLIRRHVT